jgi:hypothetical protein
MNFTIIAAARTGSTHLSTYLSHHPDICCHGESFHPQRVHFRYGKAKADPGGKQRLESELKELRANDPDAFLERIFALNNGREHVGFKIFGNHNPEMLRTMLRSEAIQKIVLFRANVLARYASVLAAKETKTWGAAPERPPVQFKPPHFIKHMNTYLAFFERALQLLNKHGQPYFFIRSDELNNELRLVQLVSFIGAKPVLPKSETIVPRERGSADIASRFSNSDEVIGFLRDRGLMHWAYEGDLSFAGIHQ